MENFNTVPSQGKFGDSVAVVNENFMLAQQEMEILRNLISPDTKFVTAVATAQTTSVTQVLPETGSTDTVYRVGSWDGIQYNDSVFSEYAWNGTAYIKLSTKSQAGEVYDISANHSGTKYADLTAALGTGGANIPEGLRKGGMSVKFVQSSDNKYVQYRLMSDTFSTTESDWQGVDDEPTLNSNNLVESEGVARLAKNTLFYDKSKTFDSTSTGSARYMEPVSCNFKAGDKIIVETTGVGVYINRYALRLNGNQTALTSDTNNPTEFILPYDVTNFAIYVAATRVINGGGLVTAKATFISNVGHDINSSVEGVKNNMAEATENLFDPYDVDCIDNYALDEISPSADSSSWLSGFIPVDYTYGKLICLHGVKAAAIYNSNQVKVGTIKTNPKDLNPIVFSGSNNAFVRLQFNKSVISYEDRTSVRVFYGNLNVMSYTKESISSKKITIKDSQYFTLSDILPFASDAKTNTFTSGFSFTLEEGDQGNKNMIVSCTAKYETNDVSVFPKIRFFMYKPNGNEYPLYEGSYFEIGRKGEYETKEWRVPPAIKWSNVRVSVIIPSGVTLQIEKFENYYSDKKGYITPAYRADGHLTQVAQFCTKECFVQTAKLGFPSCITIPKRTSDGVWVCFHDEEINSQLVDGNGQTPSEKYGVNSINDMTYAQVQEFTYIEWFNGYKPTIPTLEDFFLMCAKLGMKPMLSVHPTPTESQYNEIKTLAKKIGVLSSLTLKPLVGGDGAPTRLAYSVFGTDIEGYIMQSHGIGVPETIERTGDIEFDLSKVRVGIEMNESDLSLENVALILAEGYFADCVHASFNSKEIEYWIKNGVTEWCEDKNCSYGLNW